MNVCTVMVLTVYHCLHYYRFETNLKTHALVGLLMLRDIWNLQGSPKNRTEPHFFMRVPFSLGHPEFCFTRNYHSIEISVFIAFIINTPQYVRHILYADDRAFTPYLNITYLK